MEKYERMNTHKRRTFIRNSVAGLGAMASLNAFARAAAAQKYNVLFIMTDQHNAHALGCYGSTEVQTPNMDRIAREGVLFENAFCQTGQCCPSRYSIWTGKYARSHGLYNNGMMENVAEETVGDCFSKAGYVTGSIGKHHMHMDDVKDKHGFQHVIDKPQYNVFVKKEGAPNFSKDGQWLDGPAPGRSNVGISDADNDHHPAGYWTNQTLKFLNEHQTENFCLWYSFYGPHTPLTPSRPWATMYDPKSLTLPPNHKYDYDLNVPNMIGLQTKSGTYGPGQHQETLAAYYGLTTQIDYNIGRVLDELDKLDLVNNTIVVYTADHGEMMSEHGAWTKGGLGCDATMRVPLLFRLPGVLPTGKRINDLVALIDLLPTMLELTDQPIPGKVQGKSLVAQMQGKNSQPRQAVFGENGDPTSKGHSVMARTATHKYVQYRDKDAMTYEQLFDLQADPWEMRDLARQPAHRSKLKDMKAVLADWEAKTERKPVPPGKRDQ